MTRQKQRVLKCLTGTGDSVGKVLRFRGVLINLTPQVDQRATEAVPKAKKKDLQGSHTWQIIALKYNKIIINELK